MRRGQSAKVRHMDRLAITERIVGRTRPSGELHVFQRSDH